MDSCSTSRWNGPQLRTAAVRESNCAILQKFQENFLFSPRLIIRSSDIHAAGCFALEPVAKGTRLLEYEGERITKDEGDLRYEGRPFTYLFGIGKGDIVIDGHGMAMFVNHSCQPNCETDEIDGRVYIVAIRNIKAARELTYDYWLYDGDDDAPCHCGSKKCRGSMYSPRRKKEPASTNRAAEALRESKAREGNGGERRRVQTLQWFQGSETRCSGQRQ